jgi:hypothetical protein
VNHPQTNGTQPHKNKTHLNNIHEYIHQAVEIINLEEQKNGRSPKLDLEQKTNSSCYNTAKQIQPSYRRNPAFLTTLRKD